MKSKGSLYIGLICALVVGLIHFLGGFELAEYQALDFLFKARGEKEVNPNIVIIEIDDKSIEEFGRWPWTRGYHAALLEILNNNKPKAIAFDIIFSEPQLEHPEEDQLLVYASKKLGNVFFAAFFTLKEDRAAKRPLLKAANLILPLPSLLENSKGVGFVNSPPEADGKIRRIPLFIEYEGKGYPSLDLVTVAHYLNADVSELNIPHDKNGMMWINYAGDFAKFNRISFSDIAYSFDQIKKGQKPKIDLTSFKGKIVLIGLTAVGSEDLWPTSFSPVYPGIGIRASAINTILQKNFIHRIAPFINFLILLIFGGSLGIVIPKRNPFQGLSIFIILVFGFVLTAILLFGFLNVWVGVVTPLTLLSVTYLAITLNQFVITRFEKGLIERELQIASRIQQSILPQTLPQTPDIELGVKCIPAKDVGGDFYDFIKFLYDFVQLKDNKLGIVIGDVSGKGVPAALFMAKTMADFRGLAHTFSEPHEALSAINNRLVEEGVSGMFVTLLYLIYEPKERVIKYSNGGHNPLIKITAAGEAQLLTQDVGSPIGIMPGSEFRTDEIKFREGDLFIIYTDGISEARDKREKEFGETRILELARQYRNLPAQELAEKITSEVINFSRGMPQHDDMTVIVLKIK